MPKLQPHRRISFALCAILASTAIVGCGMASGILKMDAMQMTSVSDDAICGTMACTGDATPAMRTEMRRRYPAGIGACLNITYTCNGSNIGERTPGTTRIPVSAQANGAVSAAVAQQTADPSIARYHLIDCSGLVLVSTQQVASNAFSATVQNRTTDAKKFKIVNGGLASEDFILGPGSTQSYLISASPQITALAGILSIGRGGIALANCVSTK
jgi:hypothetical protein